MSEMRSGVARNNFERADFRQAREDLILDALGEERVLLVAAEIFKRQHRNRLSRQRLRAAASILLIGAGSLPGPCDPLRQTMSSITAEENQTGQEHRADDDNVDPGFAV